MTKHKCQYWLVGSLMCTICYYSNQNEAVPNTVFVTFFFKFLRT